MNVCMFIGNLGNDPELRQTKSGTPVLNLKLAVDRYRFHTNDDGERIKEQMTDWIPIVVWGTQAEINAKYLKKGSLICVKGEFRNREYTDRDGVTHYTAEVVANSDGIDWLGNIRTTEEVEQMPSYA